MKIALIGATGHVGAKLLVEALDRGHQVTAVVSDAAKLPDHAARRGSKPGYTWSLVKPG